MRLGTIRDGRRDGALVVISADGARCARAPAAHPTLQAALDDWDAARGPLARLAAELDSGQPPGLPIDPAAFAAPLPRAYEWLDGSAFLSHVRLARRARGAELPPDLETDPLIYQGGSGVLLGPGDPLDFPDPAALGLDFEAEIAVILGDVPRGVSAQAALDHIRLVCLLNDVTL